MRRVSILALGIALVAPLAAQTGSPASPETAALKATALDYIEGFYTGNAARVERAVHPELAKRLVKSDGAGHDSLVQMGALTLINATGEGKGKNVPPERQQKDITVLDVFENAAVVKVVASDWVDYLEMAKWNGEWKIVNSLWELKPEPKAKGPDTPKGKK
jgi:hypothetical protein